MRQLDFSFLKNYKKEFGGSLLRGKRKSARPLSSKAPIHLILKSSIRAFHPGKRNLQDKIRRECAHFGIRLYDFSPNRSHIHLVIQIPNRTAYVRFIRSLTSKLAAELSKKIGLNSKLFTLRPYTRILTWGKELSRVLSYQELNHVEAFAGSRARERIEAAKKEAHSIWMSS